jgi:hypothetical protein
MKSLTNFENPSSNPLQNVCSGGFPIAACDYKSCSRAGCDPKNCSESNGMYTMGKSRNRFDAAFGPIFSKKQAEILYLISLNTASQKF